MTTFILMSFYRQWKIYVAILIVFIIAAAVFFYFSKNKKVAEMPSAPVSTKQPIAPLQAKEEHVLIVVEENTSYPKIIGNTKDMPYLNSLAGEFSYAKNYFANTHPSIGNYFMLTAGKTIAGNDDYSETVSDDNIVRQLIAAGKTWKEYSEGIPSVGYTGRDKGNYTEHHNPLSYFSDVRENEDQKKNLVPFSQFATDLAAKQLPDFSFIVPNETHDAHDCLNGVNCLGAADIWLKENIDPLIRSSDFNQPGGGVLIIVFDEAAKSEKQNGGGHTVWIAAGGDVKKGYSSDTFYQHENTLRFMSELLGLTSFPGKAATASNMNEFIN